jgi:hypothetical protein
MNILPTDPTTGQQQDPLHALGDLFSGTNRPALNNMVATAQARNGLVSAQTQEAMIKAQQAQEQSQAWSDLENLGIKNGMKPSQAALFRAATVAANNHDPETALHVNQQFMLMFGSPQEQVAGQQGAEHKVAGPVSVPGNFQQPVAPPGGSALGPVTVSPEGQAQIGQQNAIAGLNTAKTENPAAFRGGMPQQTPEQQTKLTKLISAGVIGPSQMYSFSRNPSLIDSVSDAYDADPIGLAGLAHAKQAQLTSLTSGQQSKSMTALNTAIAHMGLVPGTTAALQNGDFKTINKLYQGFNAQTGSSAPALADQLAQFLGREVVSAVVANGGGEREREAAQALYEKSQAPGVLQDVANQGAQLLAGRAGSLEQDYIGTQSMGQPGTEEQYRRNFRMRFLTPDARRITGMGVVGEQTGSRVAQPQNAPHPAAPSAGHAGPGAPAGLTILNPG